MNYAMLIYDNDAGWADLPDEERAALRAQEMPAWVALFEELGKADPNVSGKELDGRTDREGRSCPRRRAHRHGRAVRRDEGGPGRLLPDRSPRPRRSDPPRLHDPRREGRGRDRDPSRAAIGTACSRTSSASSGRSGAVPWASSRASSATSNLPRTPCRTRSQPRSSAGLARDCLVLREPGSSRLPATERSTGFVARRSSSGKPSSSGGCRSCRPRRTT